MRHDLLTFTLCKYTEANWGYRRLGPGRFALDCGKISFILELWFRRGS